MPQAGKLHGVSKRVDASNLRALVEAAIVFDGAIDFREHIAEDGLHGEDNGLRVGRGVGVSFRVFGVGEGQLQGLRQRFGEEITADGNIAQPDDDAVGDDDFRRVGTDVEDDVEIFEGVEILLEEFVVVIEIVNERVVESDLSALDTVDVDSSGGVFVEGSLGDFALHRVHKDMHIDGDTAFFDAADLAIIPNNVLQVKGEPLLHFVLDEVVDLFRIDWRKGLKTP